jgi:hypothetical protein
MASSAEFPRLPRESARKRGRFLPMQRISSD